MVECLESGLLPMATDATATSAELLSDVACSAPWLGEHNAAVGDTLDEHGLLFVPAAVPADLAATCRAEAVETLEAVLASGIGRNSSMLGDVRSPLYRYDVKLQLTQTMVNVLQALLSGESTVSRALRQCLGSNALLVELSCIVSDHGAAAQPSHCDTHAKASATGMATEARLVSVFVGLEDVRCARDCR